METYLIDILLWTARITRISLIERWADRVDRRKLVFTRVRGEYSRSRIDLSITAFNPASLPRVIRELTLHCNAGKIPSTFRLADSAAGSWIEHYKIPAHSVSTFACQADLGDYAGSDIITLHFTYLDEHNFRHHIWIDAPGRYHLPSSSPYA
ncbi:MAG TPA: hypothetical protein VG605_21630 [Puia sp.]|jgi:hypothetical protein|nr:hypothetical protein [Puia sp.]